MDFRPYFSTEIAQLVWPLVLLFFLQLGFLAFRARRFKDSKTSNKFEARVPESEKARSLKRAA